MAQRLGREINMPELAAIQSVIDRLVQAGERGMLIPLLHELQEAFGHIDAQMVPLVAEALNLSRAEVHGVISFYPDFRTEPPARHVVKLCRAESCLARGSSALETALAARLGVAMGHAREDGHVALETVYCLGLCAIGPNAMINDRPAARLDDAAIARIVSEIEA